MPNHALISDATYHDLFKMLQDLVNQYSEPMTLGSRSRWGDVLPRDELARVMWRGQLLGLQVPTRQKIFAIPRGGTGLGHHSLRDIHECPS